MGRRMVRIECVFYCLVSELLVSGVRDADVVVNNFNTVRSRKSSTVVLTLHFSFRLSGSRVIAFPGNTKSALRLTTLRRGILPTDKKKTSKFKL